MSSFVLLLNPENYKQLASAKAYKPFLNLETYTSWLNPGSYNLLKEPEGIVEGGAGGNYIAKVMDILKIGESTESAYQEQSTN